MSPFKNLEESRRARMGRNPANIGLAAGVALLALVWLNFSVGLFGGKLPWQQTHEVRMVFSYANEIVRNSEVRTAGVKIGTVKSVERGPGTTSVITADIEDEGLPIRKDATAKIRPRLFLEGNFVIDLRPGSPSAPELPDGGTIPLSQTSTPVQLDQLASLARKDLRETFKATFRELVDAASGDFPQRFGETISDLPPLARDLAYVSEALLGTEPHDLSEALATTGKTLRAFSRDREDLGRLVDSFARASTSLASEQTALRQTVREFDVLAASGPERLRTINDSFPAVRRLVADLRPGLRAMPPVLDAAVPAVRQLRLGLRPPELPGLIRDLGPGVRALSRFAPLGTQVFRNTAMPISCLLRNAVPVLKTEVPDGKLSTGEPVYRDLLYNLVGFAGTAQNFDGNGFGVRYYATFGDEIVSTQSGSATLYSSQELPVIGSRPKTDGTPPEFRPDAPCSEQERTDLRSETGRPDMQPTGRKVRRPAELRRLLARGGSPAQRKRRIERALRREIGRVSRTIRRKGLERALRDARRKAAAR